MTDPGLTDYSDALDNPECFVSPGEEECVSLTRLEYRGVGRTLFVSLSVWTGMSEFNLNLSEAEEHLDDGDTDVMLGTLDGTTPDEEWIESVRSGNVLVLAVEGDLNELAKGFARPVRDLGGNLTHFRSFLVVTPPDVTIDTSGL